MNKKLVFSLLITLATNTLQAMFQRHTMEISTKRVTVPPITLTTAPQTTQPLAINLADWHNKKAQQTMATLGALTLHEGQKNLDHIQGFDRIQLLHHCSDDQNFIISLLTLHKDIVCNSIFDAEICENDEAMKIVFHQKSLGKALEWYTLMRERYDNKRKNSYLQDVSFPELYIIPCNTLIELTKLHDFLAKNPHVTHMTINKKKETTLNSLPRALKKHPKNLLFLVEPAAYGKFMAGVFKEPDIHQGYFLMTTSILAAVHLFGKTNTSLLGFVIKQTLFFIPIPYLSGSLALSIAYSVQKNKNSLANDHYKTINQLGQ